MIFWIKYSLNKKPNAITVIFLLSTALFPIPAKGLSYPKPNCHHVTTTTSSASPKTRFLKGYCSIEKGNHKEALDHLKGLEKKMPALRDYIFFFRAKAYSALGNDKTALYLYQKLVQNHKDSPVYKEALLSIAQIYEKIENPKKSIEIYTQLLQTENSLWLRSMYKNKIAAIYERNKEYKKALDIYKEIWIEYPHTNYANKIHEASKRLGITFTPLTHERKKRADQLFKLSMWERAFQEYKLLPPSDEIKTKMGICLYRMKQPLKAIKLLNQADTDESLFWRGRIFENYGYYEKAVITYSTLPKIFPHSPYATKALMRAGNILTLEKKYDDAIRKYKALLKNYPNSEFHHEAKWAMGWINHQKGNYKEAIREFSSYSYPPTSFNYKRFDYWKAKTLEKMGKIEKAKRIYKTISDSPFFTYYTFLSRLKTGVNKKVEAADLPPKNVFQGNPTRKRAEILLQLKLGKYAQVEIDKLKEDSKTVNELLYVSYLYKKNNDIYSSVTSVERLNSFRALPYSFPRPFRSIVESLAKRTGLDDLLVYSLIREESRFNPEAISRSKAIGLMQLLEATAREVASELKIEPFSTQMLYVPEINIKLGTFYLRKMLDRYNNDIPLALASYNAGPNRVAEILQHIHYKGFDDFVEQLPIEETKNYVKKILRSYGAYKALYGYN